MPRSIKLFEILFLASLLLGVVQSAFMLAPSGGSAIGPILFQGAILFVIGTLVLLTSRRRSSIGKWVIVIFFLIGLVAFIPQLAVMLRQGLPGVIGIAQLFLQGYAVYLLFSPDSKEWLSQTRDTP